MPTRSIPSSSVWVATAPPAPLFPETPGPQAPQCAACPQDARLDESDEEDEYIYNPLKLPLGWDGKPIPYWLYKLHGLNQEFKCEICGDASYWGRRAFERHFKEWRHQNAMRALGIPNNKNFYEVGSPEQLASGVRCCMLAERDWGELSFAERFLEGLLPTLTDGACRYMHQFATDMC